MSELAMIPYQQGMGANFVPYDAIEWQMEQQRLAATSAAGKKEGEAGTADSSPSPTE